jgi:hypothetical protein
LSHGRRKARRRAKLAARLARHRKYSPPKQPGLPPAALLSEIADALNQAEVEGITVELAHGAVCTDWGFVLRLDDVKGQRWQARTKLLTEFKPPPAEPGED